MKTKALIRIVEQAGGKRGRVKGSHQIYRLPNGKRLTIAVNGTRIEARPETVRDVERALAEQKEVAAS